MFLLHLLIYQYSYQQIKHPMFIILPSSDIWRGYLDESCIIPGVDSGEGYEELGPNFFEKYCAAPQKFSHRRQLFKSSPHLFYFRSHFICKSATAEDISYKLGYNFCYVLFLLFHGTRYQYLSSLYTARKC